MMMVHSKVPISADKACNFQNRGRKLTAAAGALRGIGEPGGAFGGIASAVPELGGMMAGAAAAVGAPIAIDKGLKFIADQRQQNASYQSVFGGTNLGGMGQRFQEAQFNFRHLGDLSDSQAHEAFMGVSQLGMKGSQRQDATNMIVQEYNKIGMSIKEGIEAVTIAAQTGNVHLNGVASALENVTKAAKIAGVNANVARQQFMQTYQTVSQNIGGSQAPAIASTLTSAQTGLGKSFQGADLTSGFSNPMTQRLMANTEGISYNQFLSNSMATGGNGKQSGAEFFAKASEDTLMKVLGPHAQFFMPYAQEIINNCNKDNRQPNDNDYQQAAEKALGSSGPDVQMILNILQGLLGMQMDPRQVFPMVIRFMVGSISNASGGLNFVKTQKQQEQNSQTRDVVTNNGQDSGQPPIKGEGPGGKLSDRQIALGQNKQLTTAKGGLTTTSNWLSTGGTKKKAAAQNYYKTQIVEKQNKQDPILKRLLQKASGDDLFNVQVAGGGIKTVDLKDLTQYYADQVQAGTVTFASGQNKGTTIADFVAGDGLVVSPADVTTALNGSESQKFAKGAIARTPGKGGSSGVSGKIIIEPTAELKRYLNITSTSGNVVVSDSIYNGVAPPSTVQPGFSPAATQGG